MENDDKCVNLNDDDDEETVDLYNGSNTEDEEVVQKQRLGGDGCDNDMVKGKDAIRIVPLLHDDF